MPFATSADGTQLDYDRLSAGPAVILIPGALGTRAHPIIGDLATLLAPALTVISYDRRGRGGSTDAPPYAVAREIEDLAALITVAGGRAALFGFSSGAALALEAAAAVPDQVMKLAMYEPPFIIDESFPTLPHDYVQQLETALAAGERGRAVEIFMTRALHLPDDYLGPMRESPMWAEMEAVAHTLPYDGRVMGDRMSGQSLPAGVWDAATMPTLALYGGASEVFFGTTARALAAHLPNATAQGLPGQGHDVAPAALAPVLREFSLDRGAAIGVAQNT